MICLVNLVDLDPPLNGGAARVAQNVCRLLKEQPHILPIFVVGWQFADQFAQWMGNDEVLVYPYVLTDDSKQLTPLLKSLPIDCIVSPLFGGLPFTRHTEFVDIPHVVAIPDALALTKPDLFSSAFLRGRARLYETARSASQTVTVSNYARDQLLKHLKLPPDDVRVAYHGSELSGKAELVPELPETYVFYPANLWPHKRHHLLFEAMKLIWQRRSDLHLVLTGGRGSGEFPPVPEQFSDRMHDLGYVSDGQLVTLYQKAEALLFTSEHEGFGMPLVEAMNNGCPVICSPLTAIPEIVGDAALLVDSDKPGDWAAAVLDQLPLQRVHLIEQGYHQARKFTWENARGSWHAILEEVGLDNSEPVDLELKTHVDTVVAEAYDWYSRIVNNSIPTSEVKLMRHLQFQLDEIESIRRAEQGSSWVKVPVLGLFVRLIIRQVNLGRMWYANSKLYSSIVEQLESIELRLNQRDPGELSDDD